MIAVFFGGTPAHGRHSCTSVNQLRDMLRRRLRHDAVAEIEDERALPQGFEDMQRLTAHLRSARDEQKRIEIALKATLPLQIVPAPRPG